MKQSSLIWFVCGILMSSVGLALPASAETLQQDLSGGDIPFLALESKQRGFLGVFRVGTGPADPTDFNDQGEVLESLTQLRILPPLTSVQLGEIIHLNADLACRYYGFDRAVPVESVSPEEPLLLPNVPFLLRESTIHEVASRNFLSRKMSGTLRKPQVSEEMNASRSPWYYEYNQNFKPPRFRTFSSITTMCSVLTLNLSQLSNRGAFSGEVYWGLFGGLWGAYVNYASGYAMDCYRSRRSEARAVEGVIASDSRVSDNPTLSKHLAGFLPPVNRLNFRSIRCEGDSEKIRYDRNPPGLSAVQPPEAAPVDLNQGEEIELGRSSSSSVLPEFE